MISSGANQSNAEAIRHNINTGDQAFLLARVEQLTA
jgi:hypothetical protein